MWEKISDQYLVGLFRGWCAFAFKIELFLFIVPSCVLLGY